MDKSLDRIDLYLQWGIKNIYNNSPEEQEAVTKFQALYSWAESCKQDIRQANTANLIKWRKAYNSLLNALKQDGTESDRKSRHLRKICYEIVESKIDNSNPMPHLTPRDKQDLHNTTITEDFLKFEVDRMQTEEINDRAERRTYVDGTLWYKVGWNSRASSHNRSGDLTLTTRTVDQIVPEPGILDWHKLNYIFEVMPMSITEIHDIYGRYMIPTATVSTGTESVESTTDVIEVVSCYYKNENGIVGHFMFAKNSLQVITWEKDWQIRKLRQCNKCEEIVPQANICPICESKKFTYVNAVDDILETDLWIPTNEYLLNNEQFKGMQPTDDNPYPGFELFAKAGDIIPFYHVRELPYIPRCAVSSLDTIYGESEVARVLNMQDEANKILTKIGNKIKKSGGILTKLDRMAISDADEELKVVSGKDVTELAAIQYKDVSPRVDQDMIYVNMLYDSAKSSSGVTDSFQGKADNTATSGKAKEISAIQSAGRIESLRVMKNAAMANVYELMFKYLLAFSDETRTFIKVLPNGDTIEQKWNKYLFLSKDKYGKMYYRDDYAFSIDTASTLSNNRQAMWQEATQNFIQGMFGNPAESKTLELYWQVMKELGYPLAKTALAGIKENQQKLPDAVQELLLSRPDILQQMITTLEQEQQMKNGKEGSGQQGGARMNSGPQGNGATHSANVERTNAKNSANTEAQNTNLITGV